MTEKEKMINGNLYNPSDKELAEARFSAKTLCQKFCSFFPFI